MRKAIRLGYIQCQMHTHCLIYAAKSAHDASPLLTPNTPLCIFPTLSNQGVQAEGAKHGPEACTGTTHGIELHIAQVTYLEDTRFNGYIWSLVNGRF